MQVGTGTVVAGKLVVEGLDIPDGETVVILSRGKKDEVHISAEDEAELLELIAEAERGETISEKSFLPDRTIFADDGFGFAHHAPRRAELIVIAIIARGIVGRGCN